ncbi:MAG: SDR family NAD(P)-dependent oxidoreductase, partial [Pseudomonadota bacterium]
MNEIDLKARRAVVTGGAQGIGRAVAERFVASGATVTLWDVDRALGQDTAEAIGASMVEVDLTDWDAVRSAAARTVAEMGAIDILVNNAGIAGMNTTVAEYPVEEWRRVIAIDLDSVFHCCKAVVPGMVAAGYGRIVNVASIAG